MARGLQCGALLSLGSGLAIAIPAAVQAEETNAAIEGRTKQSVEDTDFGGHLVVLQQAYAQSAATSSFGWPPKP